MNEKTRIASAGERVNMAPLVEITNELCECMRSNKALLAKLRELLFGEGRPNMTEPEGGAFGIALKINESFRCAAELNKELTDILARLGG